MDVIQETSHILSKVLAGIVYIVFVCGGDRCIHIVSVLECVGQLHWGSVCWLYFLLELHVFLWVTACCLCVGSCQSDVHTVYVYYFVFSMCLLIYSRDTKKRKIMFGAQIQCYGEG